MKIAHIVSVSAIAFAATCSATISYINSVAFTSTPDDPIAVDTTLASFTTAIGGSYSSFSTAESVTGFTGNEWLWPTAGTNPGGIANAIMDLDIVSGSLNTGTGTIYGFSSLNADDTLFAFANYGGDNPGSAIAVDGSGTQIGSALALPSLTIALKNSLVKRSGGGADLSRDVRGISFQVSDFDLGGSSVSSIAGIRFSGVGFDVNMVGVSSVPEPGFYALIFSGLLFVTIPLWRRRNTR